MIDLAYYFYLILTLHSQFFEYLREPFHRHALGYLEPARSEKQMKNIFFLPTEAPDHY